MNFSGNRWIKIKKINNVYKIKLYKFSRIDIEEIY